MTTPITQADPRQAIPAAARRDWCCGTPITDPHVPGCAYEPAGSIDYTGPVESAPEPPPTPTQAPAAASALEDKPYGFSKPNEFDYITPGGDKVRLRTLRRIQVVKLKLHEVFDSFGPEVMKGINDPDPAIASEAQGEFVTKLIESPVLDKVVVTAVVCPKLALGDPDLNEIEIDDKLAIFYAAMPNELQSVALGAQQEALKSVRGEQTPGV